MNNTQRLSGIKKLLTVQLCLFLLISLGFLMFSNWRSCYSAFLGGVTALIPSLVFAKKLFQHKGANAARQIVKSFYVGEFQKIILTVVMFAAFFLMFKINPAAFFLTYISGVMIFWFAPLISDNKQTGK